MILKRLKLETMIPEPTNCYIVQDEETKETMVIDPGGEPDKIIEMLNSAVNDILQSDDFKELAQTQGFQILGSTPEEYQDFINAETDRWIATVAESGVQKN